MYGGVKKGGTSTGVEEGFFLASKWCFKGGEEVKNREGARAGESYCQLLKRIQINFIMQIMRKDFWRNFSSQSFVRLYSDINC